MIRKLPLPHIELPFHRPCGNHMPCAVCGQPVRRPRYHVHIIDGGSNVLHPDDETRYVHDNADLGFYPLGPDCRKRHPELKDFAHDGLPWETRD